MATRLNFLRKSALATKAAASQEDTDPERLRNASLGAEKNFKNFLGSAPATSRERAEVQTGERPLVTVEPRPEKTSEAEKNFKNFFRSAPITSLGGAEVQTGEHLLGAREYLDTVETRPTRTPQKAESNLSYGAATGESTVRQLSKEEWDALSPMQQRAVEGNYELFMSRDDPERQAALFQSLKLDEGTEAIKGYATYEDILALNDYSERLKTTPSFVDPKNQPNLDLDGNLHSLYLLAQGVYGTNPANEGADDTGASSGTGNATLSGAGDFSTLPLEKESRTWLDENVYPLMIDDTKMTNFFSSQDNMNAMYEEINAVLPDITKAQIGEYLYTRGLEQRIPKLEERIYALGFIEEES